MRLIDADATIYALNVASRGDSKDVIRNLVICFLLASPTVDAVPVIRCKDCKFWMKNPYRESSVFGLCFKHKDIAIASDETDWCSRAERKNDETD